MSSGRYVTFNDDNGQVHVVKTNSNISSYEAGNLYRDGSLVSDSSDNAVANLANELGVKLSPETQDSLLKYYLDSRMEKQKWDRQLDYTKNQYQYAVKDMVKAGINPVQAFGALSGSSPGTTSSNSAPGKRSELLQNERDNMTKAGSSIASVLAIIAAAIIYAL